MSISNIVMTIESDLTISADYFEAVERKLRDYYTELYHTVAPKGISDLLEFFGWGGWFYTDRISDLWFNANDYRDYDDGCLKVIAEYIEDDSYISMIDDTGYPWQLYFKDGKMYTRKGTIQFEPIDRGDNDDEQDG